jgi:hypothetical protein
MKSFPLSLYSISFIFILLLLISSHSQAQDNKSKLNINFQSNFFCAKSDYQDSRYDKLNPGVEILFELFLFKKVSLSTGANYIYSIWNYSMGPVSFFREVAHEIFIPVLFNAEIKDQLGLTVGIYPGWLVEQKSLYNNKGFHSKWQDVTKYMEYSTNQRFSADLFLGVGYSKPLTKKQSVQLLPFIKYKLSDNWMKEYRNRISFGVKVNWSVRI